MTVTRSRKAPALTIVANDEPDVAAMVIAGVPHDQVVAAVEKRASKPPAIRGGTPQAPTQGVYRTPRHLYYFNGRGPWPGVTGVTDVLDKPALLRWHKEQIALAALTYAERLVADRQAGNADAAVAFLLGARNAGTDGRERGSRIHAALEQILRHEPTRIEPQDQGAIVGARTWLNEHDVVPLEIEAYLINETLGFGGTCDLIAQIDGQVWLLDWKTSKSVAWPDGRVYDDMRLQLAAYANAEFIARIGDPQGYELPAIERYGILHVTDGGTKLYPADVTDDDWTTFRACLWIHHWQAAMKKGVLEDDMKPAWPLSSSSTR